MYRLSVLYPPPADPDHFRTYYVENHLPLAAKLPGLRTMRYAFDVAAVDGTSPYFAIWEGEFDSAAAMAEAMSSPQGRAVADDVPNYATGGAHVVHYAPVEPAH
ncbi:MULTISPECIES: EthD family reductase [Nocardia]|uniref:EthD domain-containing protein n=2 Tax=Nocardia farcinica TaxID=37329 RepID=Q5YUP7_NOCFA|nr:MULTISPECIES: EthD family reductase [Nocardia]AXK84347.1 EthD family reductase [Nocardia farcinica]MBA4856299.1 EthD family reductase [Nocardia farcinica]MBC9814120.1 EthD family reductase [Nocardia farcinica]MBF6072074.1 EthD family reductase [Nocardia farcinica]MBF6183696.1 EthD family reductase [Nocardia farcinica]